MAKVHRTELPYDPMPRAVAQDRRMLFAALGIYTWARSLPNDAELSVEEVVRQNRGVGMPTARKAVQYLRSVGLWHTITYRTGDPDCPITSRVVVPPDPWPRHRAIESLLADPELASVTAGDITDGPAEGRLLRLAGEAPRVKRKRAGRPDREVADGQAPDGQAADGQQAHGESSEQRKKNYPPNPPLRGGNHDCPEGHPRPSRGCCTDRARRERAAGTARARRDTAEREATAAVLADIAPPADPERNRRGLEAAKAALAQMRRQGSVPDGGLGKVLGGGP